MNKTLFFSGLFLIIAEFIAATIIFADWSWLTTELIQIIVLALAFLVFNGLAFFCMVKGACEE